MTVSASWLGSVGTRSAAAGIPRNDREPRYPCFPPDFIKPAAIPGSALNAFTRPINSCATYQPNDQGQSLCYLLYHVGPLLHGKPIGASACVMTHAIVFQMAQEVKKGLEAGGVEVSLYQVAETLPKEGELQ